MRTTVSLWRVVGVAAGLAVAGCSEGEAYDRPPAEVREVLRTVEVPLYIFGSIADIDAIVDSVDPSTVTWKITADERPLMSFIATIRPEGEAKSHVTIDIVGAHAGHYGDVQARLAQKKEIRTLYLVSMKEAVDSTLDGRAYDITRTYPALLAAGAANTDQLFPPSSADSRPSPIENHR